MIRAVEPYVRNAPGTAEPRATAPRTAGSSSAEPRATAPRTAGSSSAAEPRATAPRTAGSSSATEPRAPTFATEPTVLRAAEPHAPTFAAEPHASPSVSALDGDLVSGSTEMRLYDARDLGWIASIVDTVVASTGLPWRVLRERLEHSPHGAPRVASILAALRRVLGGRGQRTRIARQVRGLVLGPPALDDAACTVRLAAAADKLGLDVESVRELLWIDLANERPVALPDGRPAEMRLAAYGNLDRIQRAVRRARELRLRIDGDAHDLIRTASRWGLVTTISRDGDATVLDILGPLSLFHATSVYGRALAALVPHLADHPRFALTMTCDFGHGPARLRLTPPALLPPASEARITPSAAARLARQLAKAGADVTLDPPPVAHGRTLLYPDLAIRRGRRTWLVELVGFATADYIAAKLARYANAGVSDVVLCVDEERAPDAVADPRVLAYFGKLSVEALLGILERPS